VQLIPVMDGVYDVERGSDKIRLIVLSDIPHSEHNAVWHLFSGIPDEIEFASRQYHGHTKEISTLLNQLFTNYQSEGLNMSYTMKDFEKDFVKEHLDVLSDDERLKGIPIDKRLKGISTDERLKGISTDTILDKIPKDERLKGISTEEILKRLSEKDIRLYLEKLNKQ